ncbi:hypothetical protein Pan258_53880 [Symmachiella dynata]|uniref:hypothetical protein n=1 Tax=Symmachiella dynata TaxID=2527995 RepID=UPI00118CA187|nr:hypothetical protein [Symmachiella dynata]QDT51299.1 hypothetical protein Pan258_53880 [Symmachiella dynata]
MDCLTFTAKVVESLAWPVCVFVIALLFKHQLSELLGRITKGKIPGGEFEFSDAAKGQLAVVTETQAIQYETGNGTGTGADALYSLDTAYELLDTLPRAAIIEGWHVLSKAALDSLTDYEESSSSSSSEDYPARQPPPARLAGLLRDQGVLTSDQMALFDELRQLRNQAVHGDKFDIGEKKAKEYLILAEQLIDKLDGVG